MTCLDAFYIHFHTFLFFPTKVMIQLQFPYSKCCNCSWKLVKLQVRIVIWIHRKYFKWPTWRGGQGVFWVHITILLSHFPTFYTHIFLEIRGNKCLEGKKRKMEFFFNLKDCIFIIKKITLVVPLWSSKE